MPFLPPPPNAAVWLSQPSAEDIAEAEGFYAPSGTRAATVSIVCYVRADGGLEACKASPDATENFAYVPAALRLASRYRLDRKASAPSPQVTVKIAFPKLYDADPETTAKPSQVDLDRANPNRLDGNVGLLCTVDENGAARDCRVDAEPAHDPRLDAIALAVADRFRSRPARRNGAPVSSRQAFQVATRAHVIVNPDWLRKPTGDDLLAAFPVRAMRDGIAGTGRIQCDVADDGVLIGCRIEAEKPAGYGFGAAALMLAPNFRMKPKFVDGKPVGGGSVTIPIKFEAAGGGGRLPDPGLPIRVMPWAPWTAAPSAQDVLAAFPKRAAAQKVFGSAALRCAITGEGRLVSCEVTSESPGGAGFGGAAKTLSRSFAIDVAGVKRSDLSGLRVLVTVNFSERALQPASERFVRSVDWVRSFGPEDVTSAYPARAVAAGVFSGRTVVACRVGAAGALEACKSQSEAPEGQGFGEAGLRIAAVMRANLWSQDGEPTVGETIVVPVRLLYNGDVKAAAPKPAS